MRFDAAPIPPRGGGVLLREGDGEDRDAGGFGLLVVPSLTPEAVGPQALDEDLYDARRDLENRIQSFVYVLLAALRLKLLRVLPPLAT